ncbi:MAG TPA: hypothetical protein VH115_01345 [Solirubrobacteraceae bacterium]|nr:hypothetical protein [Solirubrobacteraceae bacterium]
MASLALTVAVAFVATAGPASAAQKGKLSGGNCFVEGKAKFSPALSGNQAKGVAYSFVNGPAAAKHQGSESLLCSGTATGKETNAKGEVVPVSSTGPWKGISAAVTGGKGNLSCALEQDEGGATSTIKLQDAKAGGKEWEFTSSFTFASLPTALFPVGEIEVKLASTEGTASGFANFTEPGTPEEKAAVPANCGAGTASELSFETAKDEVPGRAPVVGIAGTIGTE